MRHTPMERFGWEQLVRRAELPSTTKLVALTLATFANPGGGRVRPGERLLADCCGLRERAVREHLAKLRKKGLLEIVLMGQRGRASVYQLTIPGPDCDPVPMRLDPDGDRLEDRPRGPGGGRRETTGTEVPVNNETTGTAVPVDNTSTGTQVPANDADDRHADADEPGDDRHSHAEQPAQPRTMTGTHTSDDRHTGAAHHTDQPDQPRPPVGTLAGYVTYASPTTTTTDQSAPPATPAPDRPPADPEYDAAQRALRRLPLTSLDPLLTRARAALAATGTPAPSKRELTLRAAQLATEPQDPTNAPEDP